MSTRPKLTNPLRPAARYRKGQVPVQVGLSESDSDDDDEEDEAAPKDIDSKEEGIKTEFDDDDDDDDNDNDDAQPEIPQQKPGFSSRVQRNSAINIGGAGKMEVSLREVKVDSRGGVLVGGKEEVGRTGRELEGSSSSGEEGEFRFVVCLFVLDLLLD